MLVDPTLEDLYVTGTEDLRRKLIPHLRHHVARRLTTDGLLSALSRLRHRTPHPRTSPRHHRASDGRHTASRIQSPRPSSDPTAGVDGGGMTVAGEAPGAPPAELLAGSALRRLHYKATRRAHSAAARRPTSPVPKVIVMGSSTTSDKTINTSTDSAATAVTSVTGTDDSLDTEPAEPPLLPSILDSDSPPPPEPTSTKANSAPPGYHRNGDPLVPSASYKNEIPRTAPPGYHRNGDSVFKNEFSSPAYTKSQSATDKDSPRPGPARFIFDVPLPTSESDSRPNTPITAKLNSPQHATHLIAVEKYELPKSPKIAHSKYETHFKFEKPMSPMHETHFKFEKPKSPKLDHAKFEKQRSPKQENIFKFDRPKSPKDHYKSERPKSPKDLHFRSERPKSPKDSHFRSERPKSPKDPHFRPERPKSPKDPHFRSERPKSPKDTYFRSERSKSPKETHFKFDRPKSPVKRRGSEPRMRKKEYYKDGNDSVAKLRRQLEGAEVFHNRRRSSHQVPLPSGSRRQSTTAQVHVTANPLDTASTTNIPAGRTTIVVQQPSLSLEYASCATLLLRDGDESGRRRSKCQEHLQQLLDVTSQFTSEDLHDFDKRYGSPHHSRSQSVKAARTGERQLLGLPQQRARVASMPNTGVEEEYYRLRHFSITGKGVVNRGDSLRSRRSRSNTSVASSASSNEHLTRASAPCSLASSRDSSTGISSYRVLVLGAPGVGKSSLVGQFMTSEYLHAYDTSIDDESGERSVCVLLAGEESEITFLDSPPDNMVMEGNAHGYCVVYSTADRSSLAEAERRLQALWAGGHTARRAVILVGNKADLARSRAVPTEEGKSLATSYDCKFIETSVGINHNVDELLVGLLTQIRLKQLHAERVRKRSGSRKNRSRKSSPHEPERPEPPPAPPLQPPGSANSTPRKRGRLSASVKVRGLLGRVWARDSKSKSCENLHVL